MDDRMCVEGALHLLILNASARKVDATKRPTDMMKLEEIMLEFRWQLRSDPRCRKDYHREAAAKVKRQREGGNRLVTSHLEDNVSRVSVWVRCSQKTLRLFFDFVYFFDSESLTVAHQFKSYCKYFIGINNMKHLDFFVSRNCVCVYIY